MTKEKINSELLEKLSPEALSQLYDGLYEEFCKTIIKLLKGTLENPGLTEEEIQSAKGFAELKPDSEAAKELLEFLESEEVKEAVVRNRHS